MDEERKIPVWVWIGLGCLIPIVLVVILFGGAAFWGYRTVKHITTDTPEERAVRAKEILGCAAIPEGYYPVISLRVPFLAEFTMLGDRPVEFKKGHADHPVRERGFFYVNSIKGNRGEADLRKMIEGKADIGEMTSEGGLHVGHDLETIRRGEFPLGTGTVYYAANRGSVDAQGSPVKGIVTLFHVVCPGDQRTRVGAWFGPDPKPGEPIATADFTGSQADEAQIRSFLSNFSLCPR